MARLADPEDQTWLTRPGRIADAVAPFVADMPAINTVLRRALGDTSLDSIAEAARQADVHHPRRFFGRRGRDEEEDR
jgi:hypothetical protein